MTAVAGLTTTASVLLDQTAYDRLAYFALRHENYFDAVADVQPTSQSMPGVSVIFTKISELSPVSTALNESQDVDAIAMSDAQVTVTLVEYGNVMNTSAKLRGTSFVDVNPIVANLIGYNAGESIDTVARDVLKAGSNVRYSTGGTQAPTSRNTVQPSNTFRATDVRRAVADMVGNNVASIGGYYIAYIHPDVNLDLRQEVGSAAWRDPHTYSQPNEIWNGETGEFEQCRFIVTPRAPKFADAGSSTTNTDVYATLFCGRQAFAKAYSYTDGNGPNPKVVVSPVTDNLRRFQPMGWYWLGGYSIFRQESLRRVESASTIGDNSGTGGSN